MELKLFLSLRFTTRGDPFDISCFLNTCSLQYRLALSVSDANVNKDEITSKTRQVLFLIATLCGFTIRYDVISAAHLYPLVVPLFLKDVGMEEKREGFMFWRCVRPPTHRGHIDVEKTSQSAFCMIGPL